MNSGNKLNYIYVHNICTVQLQVGISQYTHIVHYVAMSRAGRQRMTGGVDVASMQVVNQKCRIIVVVISCFNWFNH